MPPIDYMKVLDAAARTLGISSRYEIEALDLKLFKAVITRDDGTETEIVIRIFDYELELSIDTKILDRKQFKLWLAKFEYELEQIFLRNVSIKSSETKQEYRINIEY